MKKLFFVFLLTVIACDEPVTTTNTPSQPTMTTKQVESAIPGIWVLNVVSIDTMKDSKRKALDVRYGAYTITMNNSSYSGIKSVAWTGQPLVDNARYFLIKQSGNVILAEHEVKSAEAINKWQISANFVDNNNWRGHVQHKSESTGKQLGFTAYVTAKRKL